VEFERLTQQTLSTARRCLDCLLLQPPYTLVNIGLRQGRRSLWDRGDMSPNIYEGGTSMVMPPNILEVMLFRMSARVTATVVCCILMQILCVVSQKNFSFWGTSSPTGALSRTPLGDFHPPDPQSSFMSPQ